MEDRSMPKDVPYIVFEGEMARWERNSKRLTIIVIILIALLALSNGAWLYVWNQYDTYSYDYEQDGEGLNNINTGVQGNLINEPKVKNPNKEKEEKGERGASPKK